MGERAPLSWYCLACGAENPGSAQPCRECGRPLVASERQRREGAAFLLNELETLRELGAVPQPVYELLRRRYRELLGRSEEQPVRAAPAPPARPPQPALRREEGPDWLAEQQANLLLYLGAFLIVIATLVFVGYSEQAINDGLKMSLLVVGTLLFLGTGLLCLRFPRVQQAGVVFFAVGALMVPLNFVGAYGFFFADEDIDPTGLWLAGSLTSALFYGATSMLGLGRWYPVPMVIAALSALGATLVLSDAPPEVYPSCFIAFAFVLAAPSVLPLGRVSEVFGLVGYWAAQAVVPLAFLAAIAMAGATEGGEAGWLAASLISVILYGATSMLGLGRWYPVPTVVAAMSSLAAVLVLSDAPLEVYPGCFIALALVLAAPSTLPLGRVSDVFGLVGSGAAHGVVPVSALAALVLTGAADGDFDGLELMTRWYLPPTAAIAAFFYWTQALWARRAYASLEPFLSVAALAVTGGAAVTVVFALDVGQQWYGPAVAIVGGLYAAGSEGFGPRWFGQRHLGWMALGAFTVSWLFFEGLYADFPRLGAGVHFAAAIFYLIAARRVNVEVPLLVVPSSADQGEEELVSLRVPVAIGFIYAAGLTVGIGFYYLLASLPVAETAEASDLSMAFFGLSLGIAAVAATMRWWWSEVRVHVYAVALAMSLFVLLSSVDAEGQVALLLAVYTGVALALALWELEPLALPLPAAYGLLALFAAWRHFEPDDAYLPLAVSGIGCALFAVYGALRERDRSWAVVAQALAFGYAAVAPVAGWVRLSMLADDAGLVGADPFEETLLYQTSAASVLLLGLLMVAQTWLVRRLEIAAAASAVLMVALLLEVGHFRPENVQAYTAPLGVYLLAGALLTLRLRELPRDLKSLIGPVETLSAVLIMGPSFVQSFDDGAWAYGLILFGEGLGLLVLALIQRRLWLLGTSVSFVVLDGLHYLFFEGGPVLPNWAILAIAGTLVMAAGTAILLGRERWTDWQQMVRTWWNREPPPSRAE